MPDPITVDIYCERPSLSQMRQHIRDGEIESVMVTTIDRLSRNHVLLITLTEEMSQHNVTLYDATKGVH